MNRNQKIALGCGGAGCLGLIVVLIVACVVYFMVYRSPAHRRYDYNYNVSTNRNSNSNDNSDFSNTNSSNSNSNANSSSSSASSMSEDDKHKLYQAAGIKGDTELVRRVSVKIGILDDDYTPGANYQSFISEHFEWATRNTDFINSINTPEKARAYLNAHMD